MDDEQVGRLARKQYGLVSREQLELLGFTRHAIDWRLGSGLLEPVFRGVYRLRGCAVTWEQQALAAVLRAGPGSALSHRSAARLFGLDGARSRDRDPIEVATPAWRYARISGVTTHRLDGAPLTRWRGIPVTHLPRTLLDLATVLDGEALEIALDSAQRIFPALKETMPAFLEDLGGAGHRGVRTLRTLLQVRTGVTDSALETRVLRRLRELEVEPWQPLFCVRDRGRLILEVDFAWPEEKVALHVDGYRWHSGRIRFDRDAGQRSVLAAMGWLSVVVTAKNMESVEWEENLVRALQFRARQRSMF